MEIYNLTVHEVKEKLRDKEISSRELTESILYRIAEVEPYISSYITISDEIALQWAKNVDERIKNGDRIKDLTGIPMAIKDNICTKGIPTTCGSKMLENFIPPYNGTVVERLYREGAILLGKTNMDEFAMGSSGENSAFKITKNPWDMERVPGGSSSGSVASVASGEAFFALGSDTGGSIRQPAALCGLVGLKPTYGLVSRYGLVAYASSLDQIGPITKDVEDCALVLNTLAGHDKMDFTSAKLDNKDYTRALIEDIKGIKIGIPKEYFDNEIQQDVKESIFKALDLLEELGAKVENISLPHTEYVLPTYYIISTAECSSNLSRFDGVRYGYRSKDQDNFEDIFIKSRSEAFGEEVKRRIILGTYSLSSGYYDEYYDKALRMRTLIKEDFQKAFEKYDAIITPTSPTTAFKIKEKSDNPLAMYKSDLYTVASNVVGLPAISVPCGFKSGLPIGMQIIGKYFDEETILRLAYTYEQSTNYHKKRPKLG